MKKAILICLLLVFASLSGCGQSGPLYLSASQPQVEQPSSVKG